MYNDNILIIEDDKFLNNQLAALFRDQGYSVEQCYDGESGLHKANTGKQDLVLLDVMLPKLDGFSILSMLRKNAETPVIMLTAKGAEEERIKGFSKGADDYLPKPFSTTELLLRANAILRRCKTNNAPPLTKTLSVEDLILNRVTHSVTANKQNISLTPTQFELLWTLIQNRGEVLSKAFLYQAVLNRPFGKYDRSLDMHMSRIRRKLADAGWAVEKLRSIHGKGYCFI